MEKYQKNWSDEVPPAESLVGGNTWRDVTTDLTKFELYLMQLGKTDMAVQDLHEMSHLPHLAVKPNNFKVLLYAMEQMNEKEDGNSFFKQDMEDFLGLTMPLEIGYENKNYFVGEDAHPETIDICDPKYDDLRSLLIAQGMKTRQWIREEFMNSPDVVVTDPAYFLETLDTWSVDPCTGISFGDEGHEQKEKSRIIVSWSSLGIMGLFNSMWNFFV
jgi:hypothetical protein